MRKQKPPKINLSKVKGVFKDVSEWVSGGESFTSFCVPSTVRYLAHRNVYGIELKMADCGFELWSSPDLALFAFFFQSTVIKSQSKGLKLCVFVCSSDYNLIRFRARKCFLYVSLSAHVWVSFHFPGPSRKAEARKLPSDLKSSSSPWCVFRSFSNTEIWCVSCVVAVLLGPQTAFTHFSRSRASLSPGRLWSLGFGYGLGQGGKT